MSDRICLRIPVTNPDDETIHVEVAVYYDKDGSRGRGVCVSAKPASMTLERYQNEFPGNFVEWRVVSNTWRKENEPDKGHLFVYRRVQLPGGREASEYLQSDGTVARSCSRGWFRNHAEIGWAMIANHSLQQPAAADG